MAISLEDIQEDLKRLERKLVTTQAMVLALARQSGFTDSDITSQLTDLRSMLAGEDPSPVEVDPETAI